MAENVEICANAGRMAPWLLFHLNSTLGLFPELNFFSLLWRHEHTHKHTQLGEEAGNGDSTDQEHTTRGHECEAQEANRVYAFQPETKLYKESPDPNRYRGP